MLQKILALILRCAILVIPPSTAMRQLVLTESEEVLANLVHDLRQPLGTIDYSACCLQLLLAEAGTAVQQQLCLIRQQVERAARLLEEVAARVTRTAAQRDGSTESLDLTNSETAAVT